MCLNLLRPSSFPNEIVPMKWTKSKLTDLESPVGWETIPFCDFNIDDPPVILGRRGRITLYQHNGLFCGYLNGLLSTPGGNIAQGANWTAQETVQLAQGEYIGSLELSVYNSVIGQITLKSNIGTTLSIGRENKMYQETFEAPNGNLIAGFYGTSNQYGFITRLGVIFAPI